VNRLPIVIVAACAMSAAAHAQPRNALYFEAMGKGGLWGLGYDRQLEGRLSAGAVASGGRFEDENYVSLSPYVGVGLLRYGRSSWFVDMGAQLAHVWVTSPVPEWSGMSTNGVGGQVSTGYEFRGQLLFRLFAHATVGKGDFLPWAGADIGMTF
jgi:hypothetical protein